MNTQEAEYVAMTIDNGSSQSLFSIAKQLDVMLDEYVDEFEVPDDADLKFIKPDAYHVTLMESQSQFMYENYDHLGGTTAESLTLLVHDDYIAIEFESEVLENEIERMVSMGAEPEEDSPVPYLSLAKCQGSWDESQWNDFLEWVDENYPPLECKIRVVTTFCLEDKINDWENDESNFVPMNEV